MPLSRARARTHEAAAGGAPFLQTRRNPPEIGFPKLHSPLRMEQIAPFSPPPGHSRSPSGASARAKSTHQCPFETFWRKPRATIARLNATRDARLNAPRSHQSE